MTTPTAPFDQKAFLDHHVIPVCKPLGLKLHSVLWNGSPPRDVLVFLLAGGVIPDHVDDGDDDGDNEWTQIARAAAAQVTAANANAGAGLVDPAAWPVAIKRLLDAGLRFDFTREPQTVPHDGGLIVIFGGDGAPLIGEAGMVSVRLWIKVGTVGLILQVGCKYSGALDAAAAVKAFFGLFDDQPVQVVAKFAAQFGAA